MKIYEVTNNITDDVYIGATSQALYKRLYRHKSDIGNGVESKLCNLMQQLGKDKFKIELVEEFDFTSAEATQAKVLAYVRERRPSLNGCSAKTEEDEYKRSIDALQKKVDLLERIIESLQMQCDKFSTRASSLTTPTTPQNCIISDDDKEDVNTEVMQCDKFSTRASSLTTPTTPQNFIISDDDNEDVNTEVAEDVPVYDLRDDPLKLLEGILEPEEIKMLTERRDKIQRLASHLRKHPRDRDNRDELSFEREVLAGKIARLRGDAKHIGLEQRGLKLLDTIEKETGIGKKLRKKASWHATSFRKSFPYDDDND